MENRTLLTILPGQSSDQRIAVMLVDSSDHQGLELQHQSWGEGVGWFTQASVPLDAEQTAQLRQLLRVPANSPARRPRKPVEPHESGLRICRAESA